MKRKLVLQSLLSKPLRKRLPLFLSLLLSLSAMPLNAQPLPQVEREFRAAWIATVANIDFPSSKTLSPEKQKAELLRDLDLAKKLRLNAVVFQVRPMADAMYRSEIEPWSEYLTGEMGKEQDFDPLEFVVAEAHKRGILVHAWFNPYRAYHPSAQTISDKHISKRRPELVRQYGKYLWLDPTDEEGQKYSLSVILDVVKRYDIDGVHFDDYFYPYIEKDPAGNDIEFPDDKNWEAYKASGGKMDRGDWRRSQVNKFIETVGREVKRVKPHVMYGISPFGIWQPMPEKGIEGFNAYTGLFADSRKWLQDGTVDYFTPQLYWETARKGQSFPILLDYWKAQNTKKRHIWPGLAPYRIGSNANWTAGEIVNQIRLTKTAPETRGAIYFSFKSLRSDRGGVQEALLKNSYRQDAIIPASPWIKAKPPKSPKVKVDRDEKFVRASWTENGDVKAFWFVVYAKDKDGWSYSVLPASEKSIALSADRKIDEVVVKSVDRLGNESR